MKFKSLILGGAAIVGLATAVLPAGAYTHHPSTPAEQKQTDDLNAQALQTAQGPSTTQQMPDQNQQMSQQTSTQGDQQAVNDSAPTASVQTNAQAKSNDQMQTAAEGGMATAASSRTVSLAQIANSPQTLANASVETANGQAVGAVQKVVTGGDGKAQSVDVALLGSQSKIVTIDASQLSFDQSRNVVVAQLSADQIQALPPAPQG